MTAPTPHTVTERLDDLAEQIRGLRRPATTVADSDHGRHHKSDVLTIGPLPAVDEYEEGDQVLIEDVVELYELTGAVVDGVDGRTWVLVNGLQTAAETSYDNSGSTLVADDVQEAIDELDAGKSPVGHSHPGGANGIPVWPALPPLYGHVQNDAVFVYDGDTSVAKIYVCTGEGGDSFTDTFNRADSTTTLGDTSDGQRTWVRIDRGGALSTYGIYDNTGMLIVEGDSPPDWMSFDIGVGNHYVDGLWVTSGPAFGGRDHELMLSANATGTDGYRAVFKRLDGSGNGRLSIYRLNSGVELAFAAYVGVIPMLDYFVSFERSGSVLRAQCPELDLYVEVTNASPATGTKVGFSLGGTKETGGGGTSYRPAIQSFHAQNLGDLEWTSTDEYVALHTHSGSSAVAASTVTYAGSTNLVALNVEAALDELDAEKIPLAVVDAANDLIVGTGPDAVGRLPMGTALQGLRVNAAGNALEYATPSSSGHTIEDSTGTDMPARALLQFVNCTVSDDAPNNRTIVSATGGGGGGTALADRGAWAVGVAYAEGDIVTYKGRRYLALKASTGTIPPRGSLYRPDFLDWDNWTLTGNAHLYERGFRLVYAGSQSGAACANDPIDLTAGAVQIEWTAGDLEREGSASSTVADGWRINLVTSADATVPTASSGTQTFNNELLLRWLTFASQNFFAEQAVGAVRTTVQAAVAAATIFPAPRADSGMSQRHRWRLTITPTGTAGVYTVRLVADSGVVVINNVNATLPDSVWLRFHAHTGGVADRISLADLSVRVAQADPAWEML